MASLNNGGALGSKGGSTMALHNLGMLIFSERLVEDFEMSDTFWPLVSGGCYFLRIEEDPVKYEFFRRPQLIFKKDFVFPPKKYSNNRRFEDAIEVRHFLFCLRNTIMIAGLEREILA
jgi:hypothetical protein